MYLTIKQQLKHLTKEDYENLLSLCHTAKDLTNQAIYLFPPEDSHLLGGG